MAGRRTKLTPERHGKICETIAKGVHPLVAAKACTVGARTYYRWMQIGEADSEGKTVFRQFWQDVCTAEAAAEAFYVDKIQTAAKKGSYQAAAWWLERRYPERWGKRERIDLYDWRKEVGDLIRAGRVTWDEVRKELGEDLATELFNAAGVAIVGGRETEAAGGSES
jgi:hypothetical protein